jgi:hypothetical protein
MKAAQILKEWAKRYAANRNALTGNVSIEERGDSIIAKKNENSTTYEITPTIEIKNAKEGTVIVTLSNRDNIGAIAKSWNSLSKIKDLKIILVNPFSTQEEKWILMPHVHERICDKKSLKLGLTAMSELVDPITEKEIEDR